MAKNHYKSKQFKVYLDSHLAWEVIEYKTMGYARDVDELYPDEFQTEILSDQYNREIQNVLTSGEQHVLLQDEWFGYAITSYGRIISLKQYKTLGVYLKKSDITAEIRSTKIRLSKQFQKYGWDFNILTISNHYKQNAWPQLHHRHSI